MWFRCLNLEVVDDSMRQTWNIRLKTRSHLDELNYNRVHHMSLFSSYAQFVPALKVKKRYSSIPRRNLGKPRNGHTFTSPREIDDVEVTKISVAILLAREYSHPAINSLPIPLKSTRYLETHPTAAPLFPNLGAGQKSAQILQ